MFLTDDYVVSVQILCSIFDSTSDGNIGPVCRRTRQCILRIGQTRFCVSRTIGKHCIGRSVVRFVPKQRVEQGAPLA